jgi:hypothetical protein
MSRLAMPDSSMPYVQKFVALAIFVEALPCSSLVDRGFGVYVLLRGRWTGLVQCRFYAVECHWSSRQRDISNNTENRAGGERRGE